MQLENKEKQCEEKITAARIEAGNIAQDRLIGAVFQESKTCQPIPLIFNNQTRNLIAIECIQGK